MTNISSNLISLATQLHSHFRVNSNIKLATEESWVSWSTWLEFRTLWSDSLIWSPVQAPKSPATSKCEVTMIQHSAILTHFQTISTSLYEQISKMQPVRLELWPLNTGSLNLRQLKDRMVRGKMFIFLWILARKARLKRRLKEPRPSKNLTQSLLFAHRKISNFNWEATSTIRNQSSLMPNSI